MTVGGLDSQARRHVKLPTKSLVAADNPETAKVVPSINQPLPFIESRDADTHTIMKKPWAEGGPYWHVIRFEDHPLLPSKSPQDVPKIIKNGISDDGPMHPKSPHITAADGIMTVLHKMGKPDWMERLLDVEGTDHFSLIMAQPPYQDIYIKRSGRSVEVCSFFSTLTLFIIHDPVNRWDSGQKNIKSPTLPFASLSRHWASGHPSLSPCSVEEGGVQLQVRLVGLASP